LTTTSPPRRPKSSRLRRKISRSRRRTRFRETAPPTRRGTEIPSRGRAGVAGDPGGSRKSWRWRPETRTPEA
jgi:hypothetical protein